MKKYMQESLAQELNKAIEETTAKLVQHNFEKNGSITIEEATFLKKVITEIITEAAEDFVPEDIEVPEDDQKPQADKILTDEEGNIYSWNATTGELAPIDTPSDDQTPEIPETPENPLASEQEQDLNNQMELSEASIIASRLLNL